MKFFTFVNSLFYGENWYIYWGIVVVLALIGISVHIPNFIKSIKEAKKRGEKKWK